MIYVHGIGHFHPPTVITNEFLAGLGIGTSEEWILERTGIRSRRTVLPLDYIRTTRNRDVRAANEAAEYTNAELGARAAAIALARAGLGAADVGLVIAGGCASDTAVPAEACQVADRLGIGAAAIDVRSACTSFQAIVHLLAAMEPDRLPEFVLIVVAETMTRTINYEDRRTAVLWGDGAAAAVVSATVASSVRVVETMLETRPEGHARVRVPWAGHFEQDGPAVQAYAIRSAASVYRRLAARGHGDRPPYFIGHQANLLMLDSVCRRCGVPPERHLSNVAEFGNTGAAGAPSVLSQHWTELQAGDRVVMAGVGAGLTAAGVFFEVENGPA